MPTTCCIITCVDGGQVTKFRRLRTMFDVLVYNEKTFSNNVYRNGISKHDAKKIVKDLRKKGLKAQLVTSKGTVETTEIFIPQNEEED